MRMVSGLMIFFIIGCIFLYGYVWRKEDTLLNAWQLFLKNHFYIILLLLCFHVVSFIFTFFENKESGILIKKEDYAGDKQEVLLSLTKEDEETEFSLSVSPQMYTKEEAYKKMEEAFSDLQEHLKGENADLTHVTSNLDIGLDREKYPFEMECISNQYTVLNNQGIVENEKTHLKNAGYTNLEEGIPVTFKITLYYEAYKKEKEFQIVVYEREPEEGESVFSKVIARLEQLEKQAAGEKYVELPSVVEGVSIARKGERKIKAIHIWIFGFLFCSLLLLREYEGKKTEEKKRIENLQRSYPWFVNELVLLLGSGMQIKNIFSLLVHDYKNQSQKNINAEYQKELIHELEIACRGFDMGMSEATVYYRLGRRLKLPCYIKLMTLLEQNVKKGSKGITAIIEQEESNALETRKNIARRYGEEAGTKLLGPMILLLLIIMLIIMMPAFMSFQ